MSPTLGLENVEHKPITRKNEYVVLYRYQNSEVYGVATALWNGIGWYDCSQPGQPHIVQWFDSEAGKFIDREVKPKEPGHRFETMWVTVQQKARMIPFCYMSECDAHREAGKEVAIQSGLTGRNLEDWNQIVEQKTGNMSRYTGS